MMRTEQARLKPVKLLPRVGEPTRKRKKTSRLKKNKENKMRVEVAAQAKTEDVQFFDKKAFVFVTLESLILSNTFIDK